MWRHGFRFLFLLDAVGLFGSMVLINLVRFGTDWPTYSRSFYIVGFLAATGDPPRHQLLLRPLRARAAPRPAAVAAPGDRGDGDRCRHPARDVRVPRPLPDAPPQPRRVPVRRRRRPRLQPPHQPDPRPATPGTTTRGARRLVRRRRAGDPPHRGHRARGRGRRPRHRSFRAGRRPRRGPRHRRSAARLVQPRRRLPRADDGARSRRRRLPPTGRCPRHAARAAGRAGDRRDAVRPAARAQLPVVQGPPQAPVRPHPARPHGAAHGPGPGPAGAVRQSACRQPGAVPPGPHRQGRQGVPGLEVPHDGGRRRDSGTTPFDCE